jgi:hypothetical protein
MGAVRQCVHESCSIMLYCAWRKADYLQEDNVEKRQRISQLADNVKPLAGDSVPGSAN